MSLDSLTKPTRWVGQYCNRFESVSGSFGAFEDHVFPIRASFSGIGAHFSGEMIDEIPDRSCLYRALIKSEAAGPLTPAQRRMAERLIEKYPELRIETKIPKRSLLAGKLVGNRIEFTKTYQGVTTTRWLHPGVDFGEHEEKGHSVLYRGTLSSDGMEMSGTWTIPKRGIAGLLGAKMAEGTFTLRQEESIGV